MDNRAHFSNYTKGLPSPQNYIDWSWLYLIGASLQRRVHLGPTHQPCFANKFVIFVGEPGIGKGLPIRVVSDFLRHWKLKDAKSLDDTKISDNEKQTAKLNQEIDQEKANSLELQCQNRANEIVDPLLIPMAADATTYEALVQAVAQSLRRINYVKPDGKLGFSSHSSIAFSLQELASLMRKRTEDTVNYLLGLYDCPIDYEYKTKTQGEQRVRRGCINLLAGTTPSFMQTNFDAKIMDEGFSSRTFYIFANKNRHNAFFIPTLDETQTESEKILKEHIRNLTTLYGQVKVEDGTFEWLEKWWNEYNNNRDKRSNQSPKLVPYYARKNIHIMKVAMALHFGESLEMMIPLFRFKEAIEILDKEEKNMHFAITLQEVNPSARLSRKITSLLMNGPQNFVDIHVKTWDMGGRKECEEALNFLQETNQIRCKTRTVGDSDEDKKPTLFYELL